MEALTLPEVVILTPIYPLFKKLTRVLRGEPMPAWKWKHPSFHEFSTPEGEKGGLVCCPLGAPNVAIALEELHAFGARTVYFVGLAGGLGGKAAPGDLILPPYAHVGEGTTRYYGDTPLTFADEELLTDVKRELERRTGHRVATCPVWTTDALYRESRREVERFSRVGVCGVDMETSAVFAVARALSVRSVALLWVSDILDGKGWRPHFHEAALKREIDKTLAAFAAYLSGAE